MAVDIDAAEDEVFDLLLQEVVELVAVPVKKFNAVVFKAVVGRADHNPRVRAVTLRQKSDRGRWQNADLDDIAADRENACRQRVFEHISRYARILADDDDRPLAFFFEHEGACFAQLKGKLRCQLAVGDAPHAVGSEKSSHFLLQFTSKPLREAALCVLYAYVENIVL